uniref:VCBS repeat-containing protein n=1 Tax=uncultured Poseidoniia archaeon TaxID=1697135 RepID=A0A1B1TAP6_9ARCH|nr:hypothetical protein [uncultured Candidatus Thalassoarchaea sp.]
MASVNKGKTSLVPSLIVIIFLLQLMSPLMIQNSSEDSNLTQSEVSLTHPYANVDTILYGHDFAGSEISIDGLDNAKVRAESALDLWESHLILNANNQTPGTPDIEFTGYQQIEICWSTLEGQVRTYSRNISGFETLMHVDDVGASSNLEELVDCALAVKKNGRKTLLYADGTNLKAAQIALQSSLYSQGDTWHTRTILENVNATHIELAVSSSDLEWGVYRNDLGQLIEISFTGTFWQTRLLDNGPIGQDIELHIDESDMVSILYSKSNDAMMINIDSTVNGTISREAILTDVELHSQIGLDFDGDGLAQISTSTFDGNNSTITLKRSLANNKNQIDPIPDLSLWAGAVSLGQVAGNTVHGDFNQDGFSDLVISQPELSTWISSDPSNSLVGSSNGQVDVYYGSQNGLHNNTDLEYYGEQDNQEMGHGLTVGDFNGDGFSDLAVGSPGYNQDDGMVEIFFGSSSGLATTSEIIPGVSMPSTSGQEYGSLLRTVEDLDGDGNDELLILSLGDDSFGQLELFHGSSQSGSWGTLQSPAQSTQASFFGRSVSTSGDINNDGFDDLIVGNTGTLDSPTGYSSVEIFHGTSNGFSSQSNSHVQSNLQGTLFGYEVEIVADINGDDYDDVFISEPYNGSNAYQSGKVWVYLGNSSGVAGLPNLNLTGQINELIGLNVLSAGDTNSDGFNDVFITHSGSYTTGSAELYLGSSSGLQPQHYTVVENGGNAALSAISGADFDGDSVEDFVFSQEVTDSLNGQYVVYNIHSRNLWENREFSVVGELESLDLASSSSGKTNILVSSNVQNSTITTLLENAFDGSSSGDWLEHTLTDLNHNNSSSSLAVSSSGLPYVVISDDHNGVVLRMPKSMTALENNIQNLGTMPQFIGQAIDLSNRQHIAYSTTSNTQVFVNKETTSGWTFENIRSSVSIASQIDVLTDSNNSSHIVYRDSANQQLEYAFYLNGWNIQNLGTSGQAASTSHTSIWLPNGDLAIGLIEFDGNNHNLSMWTWNGTVLNSSVIRSEADLATNIQIRITDDGTIILAALTSSGSLSLYERMWDQTTWNGVLIDQPSGDSSDMSFDLIGGQNPAMAVRSDSNSIYVRQASQTWISMISQPNSSPQGTWSLSQIDTHYILFTTDSDSGQLQWNSVEKNGIHDNFAPWFSQTFNGLITDSKVTPLFDGNGTLKVATIDEIQNKIISLNLYLDSDRDLVFDRIDDLPYLSGQWSDSDGDGYGDSILGPQYDSCPQENRTSSLIVFGCNDYDDDGYADTIDTCNNIRGFSWLGRTGCGDFDQDGWSDNKISYQGGDIFTNNWKQVFDSDGDGYGDNHGPDCCTTWYDVNAQPGDAFPYDYKQYLDWDGDGFGDNTSDLIGGDRCRFEFGTSMYDRNGCLDSDFDGYSDPRPDWTLEDGADMWPLDPTQWADSDGDGFGDNSSLNATNPDAFPNNIAIVNDSDGDGYPDNFTSFYNGSNANGIYLDGCPLVFGNSSDPLFGCQDSDGDGFMDLYSYDLNSTTNLRENQSGDAFPLDDTQWKDTDGDGFGDQQFGFQPDICPYEFGVLDGTLGVGCRLIDGNDDDGDFVINDEDTCPNTDAGLIVDSFGCAQNQIDDDGDGVFNDADLCDLTPIGETVDSIGCTQAQREVDDDGDGVFNFEDSCSNTPSGEVANQFGCSPSQRDTDADGVLDSVDNCPETPQSYPVDEFGCTDNNALNFDWDGDGRLGVYQYDLEENSTIRINQQGDLYPFDETQWWDTDGDGYGDEPDGTNADDCKLENGTSFEDRVGCLDSDGDGWSDPNSNDNWFAHPSGQADAFADDETQWRDSDGDGYGDNQSGNNPDLCFDKSKPNNFVGEVDSNGCKANERDTDSDGVPDSLDNCPNDAKGINGYVDGCPLETQDNANESIEILGMGILTFILVCVSSLVGIIIVISFIRRRGEEDWFDDDEEDDDYEEDYQEDRLSFLKDLRSNRNSATSNPGPSGGPPRNIPPASRNGPSGGPPKQRPMPIQEQRSSISQPVSYPRERFQSDVSSSMKEESTTKTGKKVRKAKLEVDLDIFEGVEDSHRDSAVDWVLESLSEDASEREILMRLQGNGWNAPQSRAIINLAKNR